MTNGVKGAWAIFVVLGLVLGAYKLRHVDKEANSTGPYPKGAILTPDWQGILKVTVMRDGEVRTDTCITEFGSNVVVMGHDEEFGTMVQVNDVAGKVEPNFTCGPKQKGFLDDTEARIMWSDQAKRRREDAETANRMLASEQRLTGSIPQ